ncbi:PREDICTED: uncharacterized protein LOC109147321 [Ipomoea nil]|uniref:uncharacterized protein LOC109147321 n=1 Tax=Ipomoea nil TaxID=35883 RepID=UPI000901AA20|nr:PREDICTED: uncharacterized protein LOC109147321 [Ipomoea nil]
MDDVENAPEDASDEEDDDPLCPTIRLTKEEVEAIRAPWRMALIIKVMGRKVGYTYLLRRLQSMWRPKGSLDLIAIDNDYFLVRFGLVDDLEFAMYEGPWMVLEHYLIVKPWVTDFDPTSDKTEKMLVWVRIPCIPAEYYNIIFLRKLGNKVGRTIKIDHVTSLVSRGHFARICVEVDITKPLISKFKYNEKVRLVAYEGIHMVCFGCGVYGHSPDACPKQASAALDPAEAVEAHVDQVGDAPFGAWMIAPGRRPRNGPRQSERQQKRSVETKQGGHGASEGGVHATRFAPLVELDGDGEAHAGIDVATETEQKSAEEGQGRRAQAVTPRGGRGRRPNVIAIERQITNEAIAEGGVHISGGGGDRADERLGKENAQRQERSSKSVTCSQSDGGGRPPELERVGEHYSDKPSNLDEDGDEVMEMEKLHGESPGSVGANGD